MGRRRSLHAANTTLVCTGDGAYDFGVPGNTNVVETVAGTMNMLYLQYHSVRLTFRF